MYELHESKTSDCPFPPLSLWYVKNPSTEISSAEHWFKKRSRKDSAIPDKSSPRLENSFAALWLISETFRFRVTTGWSDKNSLDAMKSLCKFSNRFKRLNEVKQILFSIWVATTFFLSHPFFRKLLRNDIEQARKVFCFSRGWLNNFFGRCSKIHVPLV